MSEQTETTVAQATAAPSSVRMCGRDYRIRPLQERDLGEFVLWCQDHRMALAHRTIKGMEDREMAATLLAHAHDEAAPFSPTHPAVLKMMLDLDGVAELIWYMVRSFHPQLAYTPPTVDGEESVTLEGGAAMRSMLLDPDTLEEATKKYAQLNASQGGGVADPFAGSRRRQGARRSRRRQRKRSRAK